MTATMSDFQRTLSDSDLRYDRFESPVSHGAVLANIRLKTHKIPLSTPSGTLVVHVEGNLPKWFEPAIVVLEQLLWLEPDWDSYGALKIDPYHACRILDVMSQVMCEDTPQPNIGPTNHGGIQIEWHEHGIDLEIETVNRTLLRFSYEDAISGKELEEEFDEDLGQLVWCVTQLSTRASQAT